jgi:hypothetical protein
MKPTLVAAVLGVTGMLCCGPAQNSKLHDLESTLACARTALGGAEALDKIAGLKVTFAVEPNDQLSQGMVRQGTTSEIRLQSPDKFLERHDFESLPSTVYGIDGPSSVVGVRAKDKWLMNRPAPAKLSPAHRKFAHLSLMWLLRTSPVVPVTLSYVGKAAGSTDSPVVIAAAGPRGFKGEIAIDEDTCLPRWATMTRPQDDVDEARGIGGKQAGFMTDRFELADYKKVDSLVFPMTMTKSTEDFHTGRWTAKDVVVNAQFAGGFFELD